MLLFGRDGVVDKCDVCCAVFHGGEGLIVLIVVVIGGKEGEVKKSV